MFRYVFIILYLFAISSGESYRQVLKDFPLAILQKHIQQARHLPVCVVFRNQTGEGTAVEQTAKSLWSEGLEKKTTTFSYWQLGSLEAQQSLNIGLAQPLSPLRCYLSPKRYVEYRGRGSKKKLLSWLQTQVGLYENGLPEASLQDVENATLHRRFTLVGFASSEHHYALEDLLAELHEELPSDFAVFFVHPHNEDVRALSTLCQVSGGPSLVVLARRKVGHDVRVVKTLTSVDVTRHNVEVFLAANDVTAALHLNEKTFHTLFESSRHYPPTLLCLYAWWAPHVRSYLGALQRTVEELTALNVHVRFALLEVSSQTQHVISQHLNTVVATRVPLVLLLKTRWQHKTVVGIAQEVLPVALPTPGAVVQFLQTQGVPLVTPSGEQVVYEPCGRTDPSQVSLLSEGPFGRACYLSSHNATDNTPRVVQLRRTTRVKRAKQNTPPKPELFKDPFDRKLPRIGNVAMVTDDLWYDVIERSHAPTHPLYAGAEWRGEVTQVSLVIFIIADCASCERHMGLFARLSEALRAVEGGRVYLMNCSRDPLACGRHNVTGFPTLAAFRGLGWLHGAEGGCVPAGEAGQAAWRRGGAGRRAGEEDKGRRHRRYVQLNYHGVMRFEQIVSWFADAAAPAVENLRFEEPDLENSEDVWLVGTLLPRRSDYLHRARLAYRSLYSFKCFRFACEQLFAHASCKVRYSPNVPPSEFDLSDSESSMVITQVALYRADGLSTTITRLGEPLLDTLEDEADNAIHLLHGAHHYPLPSPLQRCEDDPAVCTDHIVAFTRDHARLSVTRVTMATFHAAESVLSSSRPILMAFAHGANLTEDAKFYKTLTRIGRHLYRDVITVSVDVDTFMHWANRFTPRNYADKVLKGAEPWLYHYPRFCMIYWHNHHQAAFFPPLEKAPPARYKSNDLIAFAEKFLEDSNPMLVDTEHF